MDKNLVALKPALVWKHFNEITKCPRPSHHEQAIRDYVVKVASELGLDHRVDQANNVYICKPATPGWEDRKGIIMQAHLDMVPQKNNDKVFNFETDPIEAYIDGEWVRANGTTLGADNGIGMASALAVLEDDSLEHGPLEVLFTATEETGMDGAFGLKAGVLKGDILLNLDSEAEGELYVGCAGGLDVNINLPYQAQPAPEGKKALKLEITGLLGGHSGIQIGYQRANANKLLFRLLNRTQCKLEVASLECGGLRNAIPREAVAVILVDKAQEQALREELAAYQQTLTQEFDQIEQGISVLLTDAEYPTSVIPEQTIRSLAVAVLATPNGVMKMSTSMEGLVQTSNNFARVVSDGEKIFMQSLIRSSLRSEKEALGETVKSLFELIGAEVDLCGEYDGWNPNMNSPILKSMLEAYEGLYGTKPAVTAIHAGLECGIIGGTYPNLDMISFGPTIMFPHSPDEKVEIASVAKFYDFLIHTIRNAPRK